ncbi:MAG: TonB-dependent receptor [Bacteroidetes bacterium]|nr:TonB-dependent receptor [Bacteroidota bacterium]MBU1116925.1 TonB-dependent receptor [Bacteroidota bacterium]MBU1798354.1 TonB-dependent receptor [Bacteroidota bacterium]
MQANYKKSRKILLSFSLLLFLMSSQIFAQGSIKGNVTDTNGDPLLGVNVILMDTQIGAATDFEGNYLIPSVPVGDYTIKFSSIGYKKYSSKVSIKGAEAVVLNASLAEDILGFDQVVVTGVANPVSKLESSISISTLDMKDIAQSAPRTTAEMFRTIPGIRSESSGGEGNANITVRGVPISAGGSKYLQLQEDGLPVLQFGDIAFATQDIFLRGDNTVARLEAIRGGSASTMASNSPAGIINFISKTGAVEGGSVSTTQGLDYQSSRVDFEYGAPINDNLTFHVGGFLRQGNGPRTAGYTANSGGQIKFNITKMFDGGYGRIYFKYLNDRAAAYMPMPIKVEGTNDSPELSSIDGFDATSGTTHSPYLLQNLTLGPNGELRRADVSDGMHPVSTTLGLEFVRDLGDGWNLENRGRLAFNSGRFVSPFPAEVGAASALATSIGGAGATLQYANGSAFGSGNEGNGLAMRIHMFDVELNNFDNIVNDFKLTKSLNNIHLTVGYFVSKQTINMSWLWNSYLMDVNGVDAQLIDVYAADGTKLSQNGLYAYGTPAWGNCCTRNYDTDHMTTAPYANVEVEVNEKLRVDASVRMDYGHVTGNFAGPVQTQYDMNNDGTISPNEESVSAIDNANTTPVDYKYDYVSFSFGGNFKLNNNQAVFARFSQGGVAKADRLLFSRDQYTNNDNGQLFAKDMIQQGEIGYKQNFTNGALFVTGFYAKTKEEGGFEATTQKIIENDYTAMGAEVEAAFNLGAASIRGGFTYTSAKIVKDDKNDPLDGNIPRRQPNLMFSLIPSYKIGQHIVGLSLIGQTSSFAQDSNELVLPAFVAVNAFINFQITNDFYAAINGNNLLDVIGITESEEGSIVNNAVNYIRARPIPGRSVSLTLGYNF